MANPYLRQWRINNGRDPDTGRLIDTERQAEIDKASDRLQREQAEREQAERRKSSSDNTTSKSVTGSVQTARQQRAAQAASFAYSDIPEVAALERQWWDIYVDTGRGMAGDATAAQKQVHDRAEEIRKGYNPMYPGSPDGGLGSQFILPGSGLTLPQIGSGSVILIVGLLALTALRGR